MTPPSVSLFKRLFGERGGQRRRSRELWLLRIVSFFISILLWVFVLGGKQVEISKEIALEYQLPPGLTLATQPPKTINVTVSGPPVFLRDFQDRKILLGIDLRAQKAGESEIAIREEQFDLPLGLKLTSLSISALKIRLERLAVKRVPLRPTFAPGIPSSYKISSVTLRPSTIEIKGPQSRIQGIEALPTEPITLLSSSLRQESTVGIVLDDYTGVQVTDNEKSVQVVVELEGNLERRWIRGLGIGVKIANLSRGSDLDVETLGIRTRPQKVSFLLEGPAVVLSDLAKLGIEAWVEIPELKPGIYNSRLVWKLPPDVRVVKRSADGVEVQVPRVP